MIQDIHILKGQQNWKHTNLEEILDYLHVEWITKEEVIVLAKKLNLIWFVQELIIVKIV